ncbi:MAG: pre-tRNA nuclear export protein [Pycnora praestabilis]|nr:MAG: pre-tRNA nuclear export protein [Pycnora praestabilis]
MDAQVENAIEIAWNPTSDQNLKAQAFGFLNQLRSDSSGWQVCLSLFTRSPKPSDIVRHVALEVVNNAVQTRQLDPQSLSFIKDNLMDYIHRTYGPYAVDADRDTVAIQNKVTQTGTYLFTASYASGWKSFFDDFLGLTRAEGDIGRDNAPGVILYLKILNSVYDEIADVLVSRSQDELKRNNELKDLVRERDVRKVVLSWQEILSQWRERDDVIVNLCLKSIGRWVSWIDISLVVNQSLLGQVFQIVGRARPNITEDGGVDKVQNSAIDTLTEMVGKKMKAADKIEMIIFLELGNTIAQLVASPPLHDLRSSALYDSDLAETVAKLVNNATFDIVKTLDTESVDDQTRKRADELLQVFLPFVLRLFSDEFDEICSTVIPSLTDLLTFFRKDALAKGSLAPHYSTMLSPILNAIIAKMKYDETSSWGNEDEKTDEAEFQELRKRLQILQQAIAVVDAPLYIEVLSNLVSNTFESWQQRQGQIDWRDLDLALYEMYLFGELAIRNGGLFSKSKPTSTAAERLVEMMQKMVRSGVASFSHPAIQLQYMEICVRYCAFFENHSDLIPQVLEDFVRFIHHDHIKVKTRSWYLFHRFAKQLRAQLGNVAQTVIESISDLLIIKAELPPEGSGDDDMSSEENDQSADAIFTSQLYLFETIGCISSTSAIPVDKQVLYAQSVMNPLFANMQNHLGPAKNGDERAKLQIHHVIMALGTLARGFSDWMPGNTSTSSTAPANEISEIFGQAGDAILVALESLKSSLDIRGAARSAFSRLIGVLGARILPQLVQWIDGLLSQSSTKDEMATFLRSLDQVVYGFKTEIFDILDSLLSPLLQRVFSGLAEPTTGTDDEIQLIELRRAYLNFLLVILNNDLGSVLVSTANQQTFETIITTLAHFAKDTSDFPTAKLSFSVLTRMSALWGGPDIIPQLPFDSQQPPHKNSSSSSSPPPLPSLSLINTAPNPTPTLPGFDHFMITRFSPLCWALPTHPSFNPKDPQAKQALSEIAALQRVIYAKTGQAFVSWLREVELRGMGVEGEVAEEYLRALGGLDGRGFKAFFQGFVGRKGG